MYRKPTHIGGGPNTHRRKQDGDEAGNPPGYQSRQWVQKRPASGLSGVIRSVFNRIWGRSFFFVGGA